jgi:hypothetical protein
LESHALVNLKMVLIFPMASRSNILRMGSMLSVVAAVISAADPAWISKPGAQWTPEDAKQVLTASPWAKITNAGIARRQSEEQLREGGQMGQPHGVGFDGVGSKPPLRAGIPTHATDLVIPESSEQRSRPNESLPLLLRWESALPVRVAELKGGDADPPTLEGDGYRLAVYRIPGPYFKGDPKQLGEPLKNLAALRREGKKDVKPTRVEVFQLNDGLAVVYLFPLSAEISKRDGVVEFVAQIGRIIVAQSFPLDEMNFLGKLEL